MTEPEITVLDHTGDYCVRIKADSLEGLFSAGLVAITSYCAEKIHQPLPKPLISVELSIREDSLEHLFVAFLNETLYAMESEKAVFFNLNIIAVTDTVLTCSLEGIERDKVSLCGEIKAATYHNLRITKKNNYFTAIVLFDV